MKLTKMDKTDIVHLLNKMSELLLKSVHAPKCKTIKCCPEMCKCADNRKFPLWEHTAVLWDTSWALGVLRCRIEMDSSLDEMVEKVNSNISKLSTYDKIFSYHSGSARLILKKVNIIRTVLGHIRSLMTAENRGEQAQYRSRLSSFFLEWALPQLKIHNTFQAYKAWNRYHYAEEKKVLFYRPELTGRSGL